MRILIKWKRKTQNCHKTNNYFFKLKLLNLKRRKNGRIQLFNDNLQRYINLKSIVDRGVLTYLREVRA